MKNKIVFNIFIIYLLILSCVFFIQFMLKENDTIEPLASEITAENKLKNTVIFNIDSPILIANEKQFLIDENNSTITPILENGKIYIPALLINKGFNANISFSPEKKETTIRLDNKAIIFSNEKNDITIIDNIKKEIFEIKDTAKIISDRFYIPLNIFIQIFEKEVFQYKDLIIISNIKNIFNPQEDEYTLNQIIEKVNFLPIIGNFQNLKNLSNKFEPEKFDQSYYIENLIKNSSQISQKNPRYFIKNIGNYNFYAINSDLEIFNLNNKKEEFLFKLELPSNNLIDILINNNKLILTFYENELEASNFLIYDISNFSEIKLINEIYIKGKFFKNIIHNNYLYLFTKSNINLTNENEVPFIKYKYENNEKIEEFNKNITLREINYFPDINDSEFTSVISINLENLYENFNTSIFFGMGKNILIEQENLYIATTKNNKTNIYLFELNFGKLKYINKTNIKTEIPDISKNISKENTEIKILKNE